MDKLEHLQLLNDNFLADRPTMSENNSDIKVVLQLLMGEVQEAIESDEKELPHELADIMLFLLTAFRIVGADPFEEVREKVAFNTLRYEHIVFQSGDFHEARKKCKANEHKLKEEFYAEGQI